MKKLKAFKQNKEDVEDISDETVTKTFKLKKCRNVYESVAKVLDRMDNYKIGFKEAFAKTDINNDIIFQAYAIAAKVLNNDQLCDKIISESGVMDENLPENKNMIKSIVSDFLWGNKQIDGKGPIFESVQLRKDTLLELNDKYKENAGKFQKIFFVRINTIKYTKEEFLSLLQQLNYKRIETPSTYGAYLQALCRLKPNSFMTDYHFENLFAFSMKSRAQLWGHAVFKDNLVAIQDKSSLIPVTLLNVAPGSTVLDMCAAPGMKTVHLAAQLQGKGQIIAVDRDTKRYKTLTEMVRSFGASSLVKSFNQDIMIFNKWDSDKVDYILLDAPCSGSGIRTRFGSTDNSSERLRRLQWLQMKFLTKALTQYPNAKRIVYSTCSINEEENEAVVEEVMQRLGSELSYNLIDCQKLIKGYSSGSFNYKCGPSCLKVDMSTSYSNGFFVALFEKSRKKKKNSEEETYSNVHLIPTDDDFVTKDETKSNSNYALKKSRNKKPRLLKKKKSCMNQNDNDEINIKNNKMECSEEEMEMDTGTENGEKLFTESVNNCEKNKVTKKRRRKQSLDCVSADEIEESKETDSDIAEERPQKKKRMKHKRHKLMNELLESDSIDLDAQINNKEEVTVHDVLGETNVKVKRVKHKKHKQINEILKSDNIDLDAQINNKEEVIVHNVLGETNVKVKRMKANKSKKLSKTKKKLRKIYQKSMKRTSFKSLINIRYEKTRNTRKRRIIKN